VPHAGALHPVSMTSRAVTITLDLRLAGDELDGRASDGAGGEKAFSGWLGLLVAIDALLNAAPQKPASAGLTNGDGAG
jgi:hypothetical protein